MSLNARKKLLKNLSKSLKKLNEKETFASEKHRHKSGIVLMGRVHCGETVGSYMIQGAIDFLVSNAPGARFLRKNSVIRIVPMLNPDGVRYGSFRTSLLGVDLNRRWSKPSKLLHPTIYYAKKMIQVFSEIHEIKLVCDMHGHTKKFNAFMYGCCRTQMDIFNAKSNLLAKTIPYKMFKLNNFFSLKDSHFRIEQDKLSTARVVLFSELNIPHCYTMEASFFGYFFNNKPTHFSEENLGSLGKDLCRICINFVMPKKYSEMIIETNNYLRSLIFYSANTGKIENNAKETDKEKLGKTSKFEKNYENAGFEDLEPIEKTENIENFENFENIETIENIENNEIKNSNKSYEKIEENVINNDSL